MHQKNNAYAVSWRGQTTRSPGALKLRGGLLDARPFGVGTTATSSYRPCSTAKPDPLRWPRSALISADTSDSKFQRDLGTYHPVRAPTCMRVANGFRASSVQGAGPFNDQSIAA